MSSNDSPLVLGLGEVLWDMLPNGRQCGGAPANFAYHAQCLGAEARIVSAVGDDSLGRDMLSHLEGLQLDRRSIATDAAHPTGTVDVELDAYGKPSYVIHIPVAWDFVPLSAELLELAGKADALCFGSLAQRSAVSRATINAVLAAAKPECLKVFDINLRQHYYNKDILETGFLAADVLKLNDEELPVVAQLYPLDGDEPSLLKALIAHFDFQLIVLTKGSHGSVLTSKNTSSVHPGIPTKIVDTVGAGDAFTAAVTMGFLQNRPLDVINDHANRVAAFVCAHQGATSCVPPKQ
jgi:fructokinase